MSIFGRHVGEGKKARSSELGTRLSGRFSVEDADTWIGQGLTPALIGWDGAEELGSRRVVGKQLLAGNEFVLQHLRPYECIHSISSLSPTFNHPNLLSTS